MYRLRRFVFFCLVILAFFVARGEAQAQSCGGSGYVCWWGEYCDGERDPRTDACLGTIEYRYSSNEGCGEYPDCNLMPDRLGCQKWTGTCYNVNPPAPTQPPQPTQPPAPTGEPQPTVQPGWQGCGSCDTCGYSGECVTDPEGNCLWDPATCRYIPTCTPNCPSPHCGGDDGCGGTCSNSDDGAPNTPAFTTPSVSGQFVRSNANGRVTIAWTSRAKAEYYRLQVYPVDADPIPSAVTVNGTSYTFDPTSRYYTARIRAVNTSCGNDYSLQAEESVPQLVLTARTRAE